MRPLRKVGVPHAGIRQPEPGRLKDCSVVIFNVAFLVHVQVFCFPQITVQAIAGETFLRGVGPQLLGTKRTRLPTGGMTLLDFSIDVH